MDSPDHSNDSLEHMTTIPVTLTAPDNDNDGTTDNNGNDSCNHDNNHIDNDIVDNDDCNDMSTIGAASAHNLNTSNATDELNGLNVFTDSPQHTAKTNDFMWSPEPDRYDHAHGDLEMQLNNHFNEDHFNEDSNDAEAAEDLVNIDGTSGNDIHILPTNLTKNENNLNVSDEAQANSNASTDDSSNDHITGIMSNPSPRMAKYLCATSLVLVLCSLGLAAAGLGMMYTAKRSEVEAPKPNAASGPNNGAAGSPEGALPGGGGGMGDLDLLDIPDFGGLIEVVDPTPPAEVLDLSEENTDDDPAMDDDDDVEQAGPKARLTNEPTGSPTNSPTGSPLGAASVSITTNTGATEAATVAVEGVKETSSDIVPEIVLDDTTAPTTVDVVPEPEESGFEFTGSIPATVAPEEAANSTSTTSATNATTTVAASNSTTTAASTTSTSSTTPQVFIPQTLLHQSLIPLADTWLEYNDTRSFGEKKRLKVDGVDPRATLLKFNFSEIGGLKANDIVGVSLKLYSLTDSPFGGKIDLLSEECNDWEEDFVSWTNAPDCMFRNIFNTVGQFEDNIEEYVWNEAAITFDFDTLPELITLRVSSHRADGVTYASKENVTAAPELVVYYTEGSPTGSPSPEPTKSPVVKVPTESPTKKPTGMPVVMIVTPEPSGGPTESPTEWPTYFPTIAPTINGTLPPSTSPTATPPSIIVPATQDAMLRNGDYANFRYGKDPFVALHGNRRKVLLEFDLSEPLSYPNFDYQYTLQLYVTYVAPEDIRSVMAHYVNQQDYTWDERYITWNTYGNPTTEEIGWFSIFQSDSESLVEIPLGMLTNSTISDGRLILVLENEVTESGADKFDFRSREFATVFEGMADTPPTLIGVPVLD